MEQLELGYEALMDKYKIPYNNLPSEIKSMIRKLDNAVEDYESMDDDDDDLPEVEKEIKSYDAQIKIQVRAFIQKNKEKEDAEKRAKEKELAEIEAKKKEEEERQKSEEVVEEQPKKKKGLGMLSWMDWK